jgi:hypothetical protein
MGRCSGDLEIWSRAGRGRRSYRDGWGADYGFLRGYGISIAHYGVVGNYGILVGNDSIVIAHYGVIRNYSIGNDGIAIAYYSVIQNYSIGNESIAIARCCAVRNYGIFMWMIWYSSRRRVLRGRGFQMCSG